MKEQKEAMMGQILTEEAKERLERVRLVRGGQVEAIENKLVELATSGRIGQKVKKGRRRYSKIF